MEEKDTVSTYDINRYASYNHIDINTVPIITSTPKRTITRNGIMNAIRKGIVTGIENNTIRNATNDAELINQLTEDIYREHIG